jgi:multidrug efflux system outer membrane protein
MKYGQLFFLLLCLVGCRHYEPKLRETTIPVSWKENFPYDNAFVEKNQFWQLFEDPILNALEEEAINANFDLQIAASRILQARALVLKEHGKRLPEINLDASLSEDETLIDPRFFGSPVKHLERVKQQEYGLLADFSYELDLWGKLKDKEKSAKYRLEATRWDYEFVYQTLVTDVALHYFALRALEEELAFLRRAIDLWKETVALNESRVQAGLSSEINLSRAKSELALTQAEMEQTKWQYINEENALATLLAKPASSWKISAGQLPKELPSLPNILPSEILLRRADIQAALALVSAGRSDVDATLKTYFPSFPLTASLGLVSPFLSHFFEWQARYWAYGLNAVQSLFDGGQKKADVRVAKAQFVERYAIYQKTVNQAFKDVEDALSLLHFTDLELRARNEALDAATDTVVLAKEQYDHGLISYLLVADSENTSLAVERQTIALKGEQVKAWIRLMRALGLQKQSS